MHRLFPWLTLFLFLGCAALGYVVLHQTGEITQLNLSWKTKKSAADSQVQKLQKEAAAEKTALAAAQTQLAKNSAAAAAGPGASAAGGRRVIHISDILKEHPEYTGFYEKQMRRNVERMYGDGLNTLNLPADKLVQLKDLLAERQISSLDAMQAAEAAGLQRGSPEWQAAMKQAADDAQQQIAAILGPNADNTLAQLAMRARIQTAVQNTYAPDFSYAGLGLSPAQSNGLVQAMADANYAGKDTSTRPANYNDVNPDSGLSPHDQRILNNAAQVLTPAQVQLLKTDQAENEKISAIMKQYQQQGPVSFVP